MALYPIVNKNTGEKRIIFKSVDDIMEWYSENPEWIRDWSEGCASMAEIGEWKDKLIKKHPDWNEILKKTSKSAGSQTKIGKI
jgi:hypothetical protein